MTVSIYIKKQLHLDYLNYIFERDAAGNFVVDRRHDFGKLISAVVKYSKFPIREKKEGELKFMMPSSRPLANAANYYLFCTVEDQRKLNDFLDVIFNIDFDRYYLDGKKLQMQQKDIVQSFIISRKLVNLIGDNETLKKRAYRNELEVLKKYNQMLNTKAYERHGRIKQINGMTNYLVIS